ncbi:MAG: addiction module antidote protein, HigA family [Acidobacteria bacterium RBG_16_68_9]|nr:MAG: addiction module antidote protein, HigA family [Acidobacteria bacterium RBG_16_68_9]
MIPRNRIPTHPGEVLRAEFLEPLRLSQVALAAHIGVSVQRINELVRGKRGITPETAWLLSQAFGTTPEFWINLQSNHDLAKSRPSRAVTQLRKAS